MQSGSVHRNEMIVTQDIVLLGPSGHIEIRRVGTYLQAVLYRLGVERGRCILRASELGEDSAHEARTRLAPENKVPDHVP